MLGISSGAQRLLRCHCERDGGGVVSSSQRAKPRNKKVPSTGSDRHESRIRSLQNEIPQEPVCGQAQEACLHAPLRGRGGLLQGHGQRRRRSVPKPDQFVLAGLCHEASQGADYLAEQQGQTIRSSRKLRRSGLRTRTLLPPPRRPPRPTKAPTAPARPTPPLRSEEHTSELQSLMRSSYAAFCLKQTTQTK